MYKHMTDNIAVTDVTKPPYNADNTGKEDCTEALRRAIDDVLRPNIRGLEEAKQKLMAMDDPNAMISFEIRKVNGYMIVTFPEKLEPTKILYFPNGTYLVSDTITYTHEDLLNIYRSVPYMEMNRQIHFKGESRDGVVIKLKDNCPAFSYGAQRPVVNFILAERSNIAMTNTFEDITIDIGKGNPGATGLVFFGNNTGRVENVKIISSDPDKRGYAGLEIRNEIVSGCYVKNVEVDGFNYGVRATPLRNFMVFENIVAKNQKLAGFFVDNAIISIRNYTSLNDTTALLVRGPLAHVVLVDSEVKGQNELSEAIEIESASVFIRNVKVNKFKRVITFARECVWEDEYISEYMSDKVYTAFDNEEKSIPLPVEDTPEIPGSESCDDWCCVNDFGAAADGVTDATDAIQRAFDCGKSFFFFQPGTYFINGSITIPPHVKRINFTFCNFAAGESLMQERERGAFIITGDDGIIALEDVFTWEDFKGYFRFIEHAGKKTVIMSDLHNQDCAQYFNSVQGGKVYIENCGCTLGGDPYRDVPAYSFKGQTVWARHINPERSFTEILNDNSKVWIMGFKTENYGTAFKTINGGHTEVLGGTISIGLEKELPAIENDNSTVSVVACTNGYNLYQYYPIAVKETQNGETRILKNEIFPLRLLKCYKIPLYVGRKK